MIKTYISFESISDNPPIHRTKIVPYRIKKEADIYKFEEEIIEELGFFPIILFMKEIKG